MDAQMKKGVIEMCILCIISKKDFYGYDIMKIIKPYFPDVAESTFYAILRRLHKETALESYMGAESGGPPRKYYTITKKGTELLTQSLTDWQRMSKSVEEVLKSYVIT